jgi:Tfp pilus assembly protein PilN
MAVVMPAALRGWLRFGSGVGIVAGEHDLEILVARAQPNGLSIAGFLRVANYLQRPAAEWGAEVARLLAMCGAGSMPAMVVLPRSKVVARTVSLPGVRDEDAGRALELQLESFHPLPAEDLAWTWQRIGRGAQFSVAIVERDVIERYSALFSEAGLRLAGFTCSGSAMFFAARLGDVPPQPGFIAVRGLRAAVEEGPAESPAESPAEVYAESPSHPLYNALFAMPLDRALALAISETRLDESVPVVDWIDILPAWRSAPESLELSDADRSRMALAWAAALVSACPHLGAPLNLLPAELRVQSSRAFLVPTLLLSLLLLGLGAALLAEETWLDQDYAVHLKEQIRRLDPIARRVETLDRDIADSAARIQSLDAFRNRSRDDLDVLLELTKLIAPPANLDSIVISRTDVQISGQIAQSEGLLKKLDDSPLFENSEFASQIARRDNEEAFRIRTVRKGQRPPSGGKK